MEFFLISFLLIYSKLKNSLEFANFRKENVIFPRILKDFEFSILHQNSRIFFSYVKISSDVLSYSRLIIASLFIDCNSLELVPSKIFSFHFLLCNRLSYDERSWICQKTTESWPKHGSLKERLPSSYMQTMPVKHWKITKLTRTFTILFAVNSSLLCERDNSFAKPLQSIDICFPFICEYLITEKEQASIAAKHNDVEIKKVYRIRFEGLGPYSAMYL